MTLATRKYNFIQELVSIDENLFEKLELVLKTSKTDWYLELNSEEKAEIEIGLAQALNKEFIDDELVMNKFSKWH